MRASYITISTIKGTPVTKVNYTFFDGSAMTTRSITTQQMEEMEGTKVINKVTNSTYVI